VQRVVILVVELSHYEKVHVHKLKENGQHTIYQKQKEVETRLFVIGLFEVDVK